MGNLLLQPKNHCMSSLTCSSIRTVHVYTSKLVYFMF